MMAKLHNQFTGYKSVAGYEAFVFHCPGCRHAHIYYTKVPKGDPRPVWQFNRNMEYPSFQPSLLNTCHYVPNDVNPQVGIESRCHLFLTDGILIFCSDCTHELNGKSVECPDWEAHTNG